MQYALLTLHTVLALNRIIVTRYEKIYKGIYLWHYRWCVIIHTITLDTKNMMYSSTHN